MEQEIVNGGAGSHLGMLAGRDLAARCAQGRLDAQGRAVSRSARKRALTAGSSSRWAGAITRTSEDQWQLAERNLRAQAASLRARVTVIQARLAVPAGGRGSAGTPPPGSVTGWSRWAPTPAWPSSSPTLPTPPGGGLSTGSPRCGSTATLAGLEAGQDTESVLATAFSAMFHAAVEATPSAALRGRRMLYVLGHPGRLTEFLGDDVAPPVVATAAVLAEGQLRGEIRPDEPPESLAVILLYAVLFGARRGATIGRPPGSTPLGRLALSVVLRGMRP